MLAILLKMVTIISKHILHTKEANHGDVTVLRYLSFMGGS